MSILKITKYRRPDGSILKVEVILDGRRIESWQATDLTRAMFPELTIHGGSILGSSLKVSFRDEIKVFAYNFPLDLSNDGLEFTQKTLLLRINDIKSWWRSIPTAESITIEF